jgi:hypothetical protein
MWQSKSLSENKILILYMFLTDYIKLYMCTKYSEYNSDVTGLSVCTMTNRFIYMQNILDKHFLLSNN